jgi:hypothetical protein
MAAIGNSPTQQAFTPAIDYFSGNGSTTAFTLSRPVASVAQVQVTIDNVAQNPSSAFTVSANTITFTSAPLSGTNNIYVYYTSPITQVIAPGQGTVTSESFGTITNFTTTGNTVLGDATTDTLTVGVTGIVKDSSGNVGIGGTPVKTLSILPTSIRRMDFYVRDPGVDDSLVIRSQHATNNNIRDMILEGSTVKVFTGADSGGSGSERMRIDSSGNVLVGTTSQNLGGRLFNVKTSGDVAGSFYRATSATNAEVFETRSDVSSTNVQKFAIYGNGDVKNTTGSYASFSDQRIKENIVDATPKLDDLLKVRIVNYNLIEDSDKLKMIGVIAQELETVFPNLVDENLDGVKAVKYSIFIPMLIKSIQELKAINDTQAETINALTARIVALENR